MKEPQAKVTLKTLVKHTDRQLGQLLLRRLDGEPVEPIEQLRVLEPAELIERQGDHLNGGRA